MFLNLLITLSILTIVGIIINWLTPVQQTSEIPVYNNQNIIEECQVCSTFVREARAAPLNPNENEDVKSLYSTL